jgi:N-acyl-L-homoserine lactone synthetase
MQHTTQNTAITYGIQAAAAEFTVEMADTPSLQWEAYRLRHQVYCVERGFEVRDGDLETDEFDDHAPHVVICRRSDRRVVGTVRLVLPRPADPDRSLPMRRLCDPALLRRLPRLATGELSRFAISKERRGLSSEATALMRAALFQGAVRLSYHHNITHWCALMERSLLRLLRATSIHFDPVGPVIEHHGLRQPAWASIDSVLQRLMREQPALGRYMTGNGLWWPTTARPLAMAA